MKQVPPAEPAGGTQADADTRLTDNWQTGYGFAGNRLNTLVDSPGSVRPGWKVVNTIQSFS